MKESSNKTLQKTETRRPFYYYPRLENEPNPTPNEKAGLSRLSLALKKRMNKIVYILGAGFSAPLGLPLMGNFLHKAKDLYFDDPEAYSHFKDVIDQINDLSVCKNYFSTDLLNIEEILSILEMGAFLQEERLQHKFIRFIKDTIINYTPPFSEYGTFPGNWHTFTVGKSQPWQGYGMFLANLQNLKISHGMVKNVTGNHRIFVPELQKHTTHTYSIVSFNYDMIVETFQEYLVRRFLNDDNYPRNEEQKNEFRNAIPLAKLHGSVDSGVIVPPTWSKGVHSEVAESWRDAFSMISEATEIRFIGYSLPESDSYVKYLFKSAILKSQHLKKIDVICYDPNGATKDRYDRFVDYGFYRFSGGRTEDYFQELLNLQSLVHLRTDDPIIFDKLEKAHEFFMSN